MGKKATKRIPKRSQDSTAREPPSDPLTDLLRAAIHRTRDRRVRDWLEGLLLRGVSGYEVSKRK